MKIKSASPAADHPESAHQKLMTEFCSTIARSDIGFWRELERADILSRAHRVVDQFQNRRLLVHVGIGGSSLGPEMLINCLGASPHRELQFVNNIDPDMLARQKKNWDIKDTFFYVVSKSGGTAETLATLAIIFQWLKEHKIPTGKWRDFVVVCTDPDKGELRQLAIDLDLHRLEVPTSVGGRFSVLTDVGIFPALWAGLDVLSVLAGSNYIKDRLLEPQSKSNILTSTALWLQDQQKNGKHMTVLMPYSSELKDFTAWWVQLWAESLGKEGKGLTPVMAYGATDQHSQVQLFMEGPSNKAFLMLGLQTFEHDFSLDSDINLPTFQKLAPFRLSELMEAEYQGTLDALKEAERPLLDFRLDELNAHTLGQLIVFFESLTVCMGILQGIDPFNQPGVEAGKRYAQKWLSSKRP